LAASARLVVSGKMRQVVIDLFPRRVNNGPVKFGRFLIAAPMLIFPVLHFLYPDFVASIVPPWIPWHLFWNYFTALTIFAAGLAIVFEKRAYLAATLLGIEILLFCVLIHVPLLFHSPTDPWATKAMFGDPHSRVINAFKDFGLVGAVLVYAGIQLFAHPAVLAAGRTILGICVTAFGVLHFFYPTYGPGIPPMFANIGFPIPGHAIWVYLTAVLLMAGGAAILLGKETRNTTAALGVMMLAFDVLTWAPRFAANPPDLWGNWLKDLGVIGGVFVLAASLPIRPIASHASAESRLRSTASVPESVPAPDQT
jgi:uncharacterized membrane protein